MVKKDDLYAALDFSKNAITRNSLVLQSDFYVLEENMVWVYDGNIGAFCKCDLGLERCVVKADQFYKFVSYINDYEIDLKKDDSNLIVKGKKVNAKIKINKEILPVFHDVSELTDWQIIPKNFFEGLKFVGACVPKDNIFSSLGCIYINDNWLYGAGSLQAAKYKLSESMGIKVLLPTTIVSRILKLGITSFICKDENIYFINDAGFILVCRLFSGEDYPITDEHFSYQDDVAYLEFPSNFKNIVHRATALLDVKIDFEKYMDLIVENNRVTCVGTNRVGTVSEHCDIKYDKEKVKIKVNWLLLNRILDYTNKMTVSSERLFFKTDDFEYILALAE